MNHNLIRHTPLGWEREGDVGRDGGTDLVTNTNVNTNERMTKDIYEKLARFRYELRKFLHFSETAARDQGITPQCHQLLLSIQGYPGRDYATISEIAERLQITKHACVGLVNRTEKQGYVRRTPNPDDKRSNYVHLTEAGGSHSGTAVRTPLEGAEPARDRRVYE
ncbi:MarR family winged helix-turn-helix transcriptional regulator [Paenibacillus thermotolerans]|uniref:MarR family winged helix-turn-helix transcriptional regulator n=1 Tax=Paenibacillus thermotolerans TaxID=3027807 RepID=UPI002368D360|nr:MULTISPECIES: helix-turn-helix domain-containing protein [unclassified Paenibacillus]